MFKATIIGNLGANAELHNENGSEFVTFKVAHNERFKSKDGTTNERSVWVSCILNGRADGLMPYLVKGATVAVFALEYVLIPVPFPVRSQFLISASAPIK